MKLELEAIGWRTAPGCNTVTEVSKTAGPGAPKCLVPGAPHLAVFEMWVSHVDAATPPKLDKSFWKTARFTMPEPKDRYQTASAASCGPA